MRNKRPQSCVSFHSDRNEISLLLACRLLLFIIDLQKPKDVSHNKHVVWQMFGGLVPFHIRHQFKLKVLAPTMNRHQDVALAAFLS